MKFKDESTRTITIELTEEEAYELRLDLREAEDDFGLTTHARGLLGYLNSVTLEKGK